MGQDSFTKNDFKDITSAAENSDLAFADLTQLLGKLEYSIYPEYSDGEELSSPMQLRPPMYYEAFKFIELFEKAQRQNWIKFEVVKQNRRFPKSNTDWIKYSQKSFDPVKALIYPSIDSILSKNHKEWQELIYVFNLAQAIIFNQNVPQSIQYRYRDRITVLNNQNSKIKSLTTKSIAIHAFDPYIIKAAKKQANTLLQKGNSSCNAYIKYYGCFKLYWKYVLFFTSKA